LWERLHLFQQRIKAGFGFDLGSRYFAEVLPISTFPVFGFNEPEIRRCAWSVLNAARSFFLATEFSSQVEKFWVGPSVPAYAGLLMPSRTKPDQSVAWSM
jgi:hypothetical protein